jgi:uncharacterized protein YicC (UPF0701 family)
VSAWIKGDIIIRFPTAAELSKKSPLSTLSLEPPVNAEVKIKEHYIDLLSICAGTKEATPQEREKAITELFRMLLMFRSANRIEGKILSDNVAARIEKLERDVQSLKRQIDQLVTCLLRKGLSKERVRKQPLDSSSSHVSG